MLDEQGCTDRLFLRRHCDNNRLPFQSSKACCYEKCHYAEAYREFGCRCRSRHLLHCLLLSPASLLWFPRLQSIEARRRYDPLPPISDEKYDPEYKNMKKSFYKRFECKGEEANRELTYTQMHKILPAVYPWKD